MKEVIKVIKENLTFKELPKDQQEAYIKGKSFVSESVVTDEIRADLLKLGWIVIDDPKAY